MPPERHIDDLTACDGIKFWMSDGERPVLCRVSHEALRDLALSGPPKRKSHTLGSSLHPNPS